MLHTLRFASASAHIDVPPVFIKALFEEQSTQEIILWADSVALLLDTLQSGVVFAIGKLRLSEEGSRTLAHSIAAVVCQALQRRGAPSSMRVEIDRPQGSSVRANYQVRTLLPHHDGGHCSYLTTSMLDDPRWNVLHRTFSNEAGSFTTTQAHKLYQGIFLANPGEGLSVTTYYNLVLMLQQAYQHATGQFASSISQLAFWLSNNIERSLSLQPQHRSNYLAIGAVLGSQNLTYHGIAAHYAEAEFTSHEIERFPALKYFNENTPCPGESFLNQVLIETLGLSWEDCRAKFEICVPGERFDLILGHNLTLLHGGLMGGADRVLEPICMVVDHAGGDEYESWLAHAWRRGEKVYEER